MGCASSHSHDRPPEEEDDLPASYLDDHESGEFVRSVSQHGPSIRITSRSLNIEEVQEQRMKQMASGEAVTGKRSFVAGMERKYGRRMSKLSSLDRSQMIEDIKEVSDKRIDNRDGLENRLDAFGMKMKVMEGDGNCQFRSIAFNLFGDQVHHAIARKAAVEHMQKHKDFFSMFFESGSEFKSYVKDMSKNRTWGDELTLRAVVEAYSCEAHVVTSSSANWYLVYQPENEDERDPKIAATPKGQQPPQKGKQIFLSYISPIHYNSIVAWNKKKGQ